MRHQIVLHGEWLKARLELLAAEKEFTRQRDALTRRRMAMPGLDCGQCCANLMAILLVIGVMDLSAMAVVTAAISAERLAPAGERVARATGAVAVGAGLFLIARAAQLG
jgi:predicted metal-binding membrane protein